MVRGKPESGGSATPAVAAAWKAVAVGTLATTSFVYGLSETYEGIDNVVLGRAGDGMTVAVNPVRDVLPRKYRECTMLQVKEAR